MKDLFTATPAEREIIERIAKRAADIMADSSRQIVGWVRMTS